MPTIDLDKLLVASQPPRDRIPPDFEWSPMQEDIFHAVASTTANLSIEAVAGSGKTTTIIEAMHQMPGQPKALFLAFNKSIAVTLASKVPSHVEAKTFNALGNGLLRKLLKQQELPVDFNKNKVWAIVRKRVPQDIRKEHDSDIVRILRLARANAVGTSPETCPSLAETFAEIADNLVLDLPPVVLQRHLPRCWEDMNRLDGTIDFDDQLYMPVLHDMTFPRYDVVFVDEAQDLSAIQHEMLCSLAARGARIIAVGDSHQAIYGFRGADHRSMAKLANIFDAVKLPLSVCYRCPQSVVALAAELVPHITCPPTAPAGNVKHVREMPTPGEFEINSMVLCRLNYPLFSLAMAFLRAGIPCQLKSDFPDQLKKFISKFDATTNKDFLVLLDSWYEREYSRLESRKRWGALAALTDRFDTLRYLASTCDTPKAMIATINRLLVSSSGPTLSTIHKAKGLEAETVYVLRPDVMPSRFAKTPSDFTQENNLMYVCYTRALHSLTFLPTEGAL